MWSHPQRRGVIKHSAVGGLAGLAAYLLDTALVELTLNGTVPVRIQHIALYAAVGISMSWYALWRTGSRQLQVASQKAQLETTFWTAAALLYVPAIAERLAYGGQLVGLEWLGLGVAGLIVALVAIGSLEVLTRIAGSRAKAGMVFAVTVSLLLAINRNVLEEPFAASSLSLDLTLAGVAVLAAWASRVKLVERGLLVLMVSLLGGSLLGLFGRGTGFPVGPASQSARPNLLLIVVDTLRYDVFQEVLERTPEGLRLQEQLRGATWFEHAIAAAPWTAPSMASILTGLYPDEHGVVPKSRDHAADITEQRDRGRPLRPLPNTIPTLATRLSDHGYRTAAFVTNPLLHEASGLTHGFQHYELLPLADNKLPLLTFFADLGWLDRLVYHNAAEVRSRVAGALEDGLANHAPFFWWIHLLDPHSPLHSHRQLALEGESESLDVLYRREVRFATGELARLLELLDQSGSLKNTFLVLTSDHGEILPGDERRSRGSVEYSYGHGQALYDELVRIPLVIKPPAAVRSPRPPPLIHRSQLLTSHVDINTTVLDLLGIEDPLRDHRFSLAPTVVDRREAVTTEVRQAALIGSVQKGIPQRGLRTLRHKLINYQMKKPVSELFVIADDPLEKSNVSNTRPRLRGDLQERLSRAYGELREPPVSNASVPDAQLEESLRALGYIE